jgi:dTDP-4-dehydrorhamnose 3,5-epimerase-like enzyme
VKTVEEINKFLSPTPFKKTGTGVSPVKTVEEINKSENIDGVLKIDLDTFHDDRGEIWTIHSQEYCGYKFVADKMSVSRFGVLRGFHGDAHTAKLISCLNGYMQLALLDLRKDSLTYGGVETYLLSDDKPSVVIGRCCKCSSGLVRQDYFLL